MESEAARLRSDIERYRRLLEMVGDRVAIEALERLIAEREKRLLSIEGDPSKGGS
jgi:hypothetical protein